MYGYLDWIYTAGIDILIEFAEQVWIFRLDLHSRYGYLDWFKSQVWIFSLDSHNWYGDLDKIHTAGMDIWIRFPQQVRIFGIDLRSR